MQKNLKKYGWLFLLPTAVAFLFAFAAPFVLGVGLSFTRFRTVTDAAWVGLQNYVPGAAGHQFLSRRVLYA